MKTELKVYPIMFILHIYLYSISRKNVCVCANAKWLQK